MRRKKTATCLLFLLVSILTKEQTLVRCNVIVEAGKKSKCKTQIYKPRNENERTFVFANSFNDSLKIFCEGKELYADFFKTGFSSGITNKEMNFTYFKKEVTFQVISDSSKLVCHNVTFILSRGLLKRFYLFYVYRDSENFIIRGVRCIPLLE